jgi:hypothetical protein
MAEENGGLPAGPGRFNLRKDRWTVFLKCRCRAACWRIPRTSSLPPAPIGGDLSVERCRRDPQTFANGLDRDVRVLDQALTEPDASFP